MSRPVRPNNSRRRIALWLLSAFTLLTVGNNLLWAPRITADVLLPPLPTNNTADIIADFTPPAQDWLPGHRGIDVRMAPGTQIRSPADGVLSWKGQVAKVPVLVVQHGHIRTTFQPAISQLAVGTPVAQGDPVGALAGSVSHCGEPCLHWGLKRGDTYLDPRLLWGSRAVLVPPPLN